MAFISGEPRGRRARAKAAVRMGNFFGRAGPAASDPSLTAKLEVLKRLRDGNQLNEEEYKEKVHYAIDNFCGVERPDPDMCKFLECLRAPGLVKDDVLSLPADVFLGGTRRLGFIGGTMLIRECYKALSDIILDMAEKNKTEEAQNFCFMIKGNPGIGKSLFSYYMIYILMQLKKTIVWRPCGYKSSICIMNRSLRKSADGFPNQLAESSTWYIVDADVPDHVEANTLLLCSPKKSIYKKFMNAGAHVLFMPVWTWDEIEKAQKRGLGRSRIGGKNGELEDVRKLFDKWGGIPRYVFDSANNQAFDDLLKSAITRADLMKIKLIIGQPDNSDVADHMLVQMVASSKEGAEAFQSAQYAFASSYVERELTTAFFLTCRDSMIKFMLEYAGNKSAAGIYGSLFELYAHNLLVSGGRFDVRKLQKEQGSTEVSALQLGNDSTMQVFATLNCITVQQKVYWQPKQKNFVAIDSLVYPDCLFQVTVSLDHPVQFRGIQTAANRLLTLQKENEIFSPKRMKLDGDPPRVIRLFFVVPDGIFDKYLEQSYLNVNGGRKKRPVLETTWTSDVAGMALRVEQYALKLCITPTPAPSDSLSKTLPI